MTAVPGAGELVIICAAIAGAGLGFLWFNTYPAMVFMGDIGALALGAVLLCISMAGIFLNRKNVIILLMCIELMLLAVNINFVAFSREFGDAAGQIFVFFILTVAAAEAAIGLAIQQGSPFAQTLVSGDCGLSFAYLPTADAYPLGGYEIEITPFAPEAADVAIAAAIEVLRDLKDPA